ncbi:hypothetical protein MKX01_000133 [Papaver californicum]|nr:hypothetical protein MKX01_000133 [Papaver californicum]
MDSTEELLRKTLDEKQKIIESQGNIVRDLKSSSVTDKSALDEAIKTVNSFKLEKSSIEQQLLTASSSNGSSFGGVNKEFFWKNLVNTLESRLFYIPSFKIYSGVVGLYDYGPPGCAVKPNFLAFWLNVCCFPFQHFVQEENMLEVDCPCVTPEVVLKASGHVEKFTDLMVKDEKTGTCYRADHLLKDFCKEKLEKDLSLSIEKIKEYGMFAPDKKNPLSDPYPFNLMFQTSIGPSGTIHGYMRPETAQGIFVNFKDLYYYNGSKLPFAAAQIGQAFRNEISPRPGLLRVREFTLAEIEHFVDPEDKSHSKYSEVVDLEFLMFPREEQMTGKDAVKLRLGDAVSNVRHLFSLFICSNFYFIRVGFLSLFIYPYCDITLVQGTVNNETLVYSLGGYFDSLHALGSVKNVYGFASILQMRWPTMQQTVGILRLSAPMAAYDLRAHSEKSGTLALVAHEKFSAPKEVEKLVITPVKKELGLAFKGNQKKIVEVLEAMDEKEAMEVKTALESKGEVGFQVCTLGKAVTIKSNMVSISKEIKKEHQRVFTPSVIEPYFGIGRIIYCLFEHSFYTRLSKAGDEQLNVFSLPPVVAPIKCTVFLLVQNLEYARSLTVAGISHSALSFQYRAPSFRRNFLA